MPAAFAKLDEMSSPDFCFPGSVGLLVSFLFVATELILFPLFEQAKERLTTAYLRYSVARGSSIWLCGENKLIKWVGVADGVSAPWRGLVVPRLLKIFFKLALLVSFFVFEFNIEPVKVAKT